MPYDFYMVVFFSLPFNIRSTYYCCSALCYLVLCSRGFALGVSRILCVFAPFGSRVSCSRKQPLRCRSIRLRTTTHTTRSTLCHTREMNQAQGVWKYEFDIEAPGSRTQSLHHRILREIKNKSDFPGYRKGEVRSNAVKRVLSWPIGNLEAPTLGCHMIR